MPIGKKANRLRTLLLYNREMANAGDQGGGLLVGAVWSAFLVLIAVAHAVLNHQDLLVQRARLQIGHLPVT